MMKFLIVEDSEESSHAIEVALNSLNGHCVTVTSLSDAESKLKEADFNAFIVDLTLPDGDGANLVSLIRGQNKYSQTPIIILTGDGEINRKVDAFSNGADDYILKPFNVLELRARLESKLKKVQLSQSLVNSESSRIGELSPSGPDRVVDKLVAGPMTLSLSQQTVGFEGESPVALSSTEFRILSLLVRNPGNVFSRSEILETIWGNSMAVTDRTVDSHVYTLRKKMGEHRKVILSVQGEGYRYIGPTATEHRSKE